MNKLENNKTAQKVYNFIIENIGDHEGLQAGMNVMEEKLGLARPTLYRAVKFLKDNEYIYVLNNKGSNIYVLDKNVIKYKTLFSDKEYCILNVRFLLTSKEEKELKERIQGGWSESLNEK